MTAGELIIGSGANTGGIVVTANITASGYTTLNVYRRRHHRSGRLRLDPTNLALSAYRRRHQFPMITVVTNLVAQNATSGGIFISNTGDLTIGFTGDPFQGVQVATAGDLSLTDAGSVTVTTSGENIQGPANVTVTANGATTNIQTGGFQEAIQNLGAGTVTLTAGQDIILGTTGPGSSYGDVNANAFGNPSAAASVVLNAGRDVTIQGTGAPTWMPVTAVRSLLPPRGTSQWSATSRMSLPPTAALANTINANDMIINDSIRGHRKGHIAARDYQRDHRRRNHGQPCAGGHARPQRCGTW